MLASGLTALRSTQRSRGLLSPALAVELLGVTSSLVLVAADLSPAGREAVHQALECAL